MNKSLFKSFISPYNAWTINNSRYRQVVPFLVCVLLAIPVIFLPLRSFAAYLMGQVIVFLLFPIFVWVDLNTETETDMKLDVIKTFVMIILYSTYLMILAWIMIIVFKPSLRVEYMLVNIGYIFLLLIITVIVATVALYHRYAQNVIQQKKYKKEEGFFH